MYLNHMFNKFSVTMGYSIVIDQNITIFKKLMNLGITYGSLKNVDN